MKNENLKKGQDLHFFRLLLDVMYSEMSWNIKIEICQNVRRILRMIIKYLYENKEYIY